MIEFEKAQAARELRQAADDIEQGRFEGAIWGVPKISLLEPVKTEVEISDRSHQLKREYMVRVEARLKVSPDMLDQAQVLRQAANDLEREILIATRYAPCSALSHTPMGLIMVIDAS